MRAAASTVELSGSLPRRGGRQDDLADAGDAGRYGSHQDGGRVGCGAAGSVETDTLQGANQFAEAAAQVNPVAGQRGFVELGDAAGGQFQRLFQVRRRVVPGCVQLGLGHLQIVKLGIVQQFGVAADGGVAPGADIAQHLQDGGLRRGVGAEEFAGALQDRCGQRRQVEGVDAGQGGFGGGRPANLFKLH